MTAKKDGRASTSAANGHRGGRPLRAIAEIAVAAVEYVRAMEAKDGSLSERGAAYSRLLAAVRRSPFADQIKS